VGIIDDFFMLQQTMLALTVLAKQAHHDSPSKTGPPFFLSVIVIVITNQDSTSSVLICFHIYGSHSPGTTGQGCCCLEGSLHYVEIGPMHSTWVTLAAPSGRQQVWRPLWSRRTRSGREPPRSPRHWPLSLLPLPPLSAGAHALAMRAAAEGLKLWATTTTACPGVV
jgi:hypothetical protein